MGSEMCIRDSIQAICCTRWIIVSAEKPAMANQNICDRTLEEWSVVLRADVENTDEWKNQLILFEDGQVTGISGVRIGGNW